MFKRKVKSFSQFPTFEVITIVIALAILGTGIYGFTYLEKKYFSNSRILPPDTPTETSEKSVPEDELTKNQNQERESQNQVNASPSEIESVAIQKKIDELIDDSTEETLTAPNDMAKENATEIQGRDIASETTNGESLDETVASDEQEFKPRVQNPLSGSLRLTSQDMLKKFLNTKTNREKIYGPADSLVQTIVGNKKMLALKPISNKPLSETSSAISNIISQSRNFTDLEPVAEIKEPPTTPPVPKAKTLETELDQNQEAKSEPKIETKKAVKKTTKIEAKNATKMKLKQNDKNDVQKRLKANINLKASGFIDATKTKIEANDKKNSQEVTENYDLQINEWNIESNPAPFFPNQAPFRKSEFSFVKEQNTPYTNDESVAQSKPQSKPISGQWNKPLPNINPVKVELEKVIPREPTSVVRELGIKNYYTLQVGAFLEVEKAQEMIEKLNRDGLRAYFVKRTSKYNQKDYHFVMVGKFSAVKQAYGFQPELYEKSRIKTTFIRVVGHDESKDEFTLLNLTSL